MAKGKSAASKRSRVYKTITVTGTSPKGYEDAIKVAVKQAARSLDGLAWFEVTEFRGLIEKGDVAEFQATVDLGFRLRG